MNVDPARPRTRRPGHDPATRVNVDPARPRTRPPGHDPATRMNADPARPRTRPPGHDPATRVNSTGTLRLVTTSGQHGRDVIGESVTIEHVDVDPAFRRRGFAVRLLLAAEDWLRANPDLPQTLTLGVETTNAPAIALYRKLGYTIATEFDGPAGNRCYAMFKRLE